MTQSRPAELEIDLGALKRNVERVRAHLDSGVQVIGSVKADGYGHGAVEVARALAHGGVEMVATASVDEAAAIVDAGAHDRVLVFGGFSPQATPELCRRGLIPSVANRQSADAVAEASGSRTVFVKVDAGLGRLGVSLDEAQEVVALLDGSGVRIEGIYTHLPFADEQGAAWARDGLARFGELVGLLRGRGHELPVTQALSSPGISAGLSNPFTAVCPGRLLYGLAPAVGSAHAWGLEPAMRSIRAEIVHLRRHAAGARIGAGGSSAVRESTLVGVIPFGHANGYRHGGSAPLEALHRGRRRRVLGISLEHTTVDLGEGPAQLGDDVFVLGGDAADAPTVAEIAAAADTTPLEFLVGLAGRTPRRYAR